MCTTKSGAYGCWMLSAECPGMKWNTNLPRSRSVPGTSEAARCGQSQLVQNDMGFLTPTPRLSDEVSQMLQSIYGYMHMMMEYLPTFSSRNIPYTEHLGMSSVMFKG